MKIWERITAVLATPPFVAEPVCVQDGGLRAYIWPAKQHFGYEVVDAGGEKLCVGAERSFGAARSHAMEMLRRLR